jgi:DNA-binding response OmpR family regulator
MKNYTILYAEDENKTRQQYTKYLKRYFKEVYNVSSGDKAILLYEKYNIDIFLLDINMPIKNGLEVAQYIRKKDKISRIIILTAHLEQDKLLLATELNLTKYLQKPISRNDLKTTLNKAVFQLKELKEQIDIIYLDDNYRWDKINKILKFNNEYIKLTKYETLLLEILSSQLNTIFSLDEISIFLWEDIYSIQITTNKIKDIIKRIRKKLPKNTIVNVYGLGYRLAKK